MVDDIIEGRIKKIADDFSVLRVLPSVKKRTVGPFLFFDHMGPVEFPAGRMTDVLPHPHIGLATITYLFEGEMEHRDSVGSHSIIRPGDVNWMTAGRGIVHSERATVKARGNPTRLHGLQIWVGLPQAWEETEPSFEHAPGETIPVVEKDGVTVRILVGSILGQTSPVRTLSPLFYGDVKIKNGETFTFPTPPGECALYVVEGELVCGEKVILPRRLAVIHPETDVVLRARAETRFVLFGGDPLDGPRHMDWNFVSSSPARIQRAIEDWKAMRFPLIPGDDREFVPYPDRAVPGS